MSELIGGCPFKSLWLFLLSLVQKVLVWRHAVLVKLHHIVDGHLQFVDAFLVFNVKLLKIDHAEVIYHVHDHFVQLEELLGEKISLIHLVADDGSAGWRFTNFVKKLFVRNFVALCQHVDMRQAHLHHSWNRSEGYMSWFKQEFYLRKTGCDILGRLVQESAVGAIDSAKIKAILRDSRAESRHYVKVWVELNLPRTVKDDERVISEGIKLLNQPFNVLN